MGRTLEMEALIDPASWEVQQLSLSGTGEIFRRDPSTGDQTLAGRVCLFDVRDQSRLRAAGAGTFIPAEGAGLIRSTESPEAFGILKSATLERSNVNLLDEMTQLLMTQRAYQLSAKSVGSADEMMQLINEII
jgi:flagellar basal-body rod protein FlgG